MEGRRVGFLNPVKFFFISFVVQVLFGTFALWLSHDQQFESLTKLDSRLEFVGLISTIFWGGLWALMFRRSGFNLVENMASALFFVGQSNFYGIILDALMIPLHSIAPGAATYIVFADIAVVIGYGFFFVRKVFGEPWYLVVPKHIFLSILFLIITLLVSIGGAVLVVLSGYSAR